VEVYRYNINTDTHERKAIIYRPPTSYEIELLAVDTASIVETILHTEDTGSLPFTADLDLRIDDYLYATSSEDAYGFTVDINDNLLAVGNPYFKSFVNTGTASFSYTGSGYVDVFDLNRFSVNPYPSGVGPEIIGYEITGGFVSVDVSVPANQNFGYVILESKATSSSTYAKISVTPVSNNGGNIAIPTNYTTTSSTDFRVSAVVSFDPYLTTIFNPNPAITESFGWSVSLNDEWMAIGSIHESSSKGAVFMYQKVAGNDSSWSFYQTISPPSDIVAGDVFGFAVDMNKFTGSFSHSMVIGSLKASQSKAYVYELDDSGSWINRFILQPDNTTIYPLTFSPTIPIPSGSFPNYTDGFGRAVAINHTTVVVGAPTDRHIYEYSGSSGYNQGAVYFFERCENTVRDGYYLARKSYGNEKIMKNNLLGWSVDIFNDYAVAGAPKTTILSASVCYLRGSLFQEHHCNVALENTLDGQFVLYHKSTGSIPDTTNIDWDVTNVYQVKKRLLEPYRAYGFDVAICDPFIVIGAPMMINGDNTVMSLDPNVGAFTGSISDIGDLNGKSYIYNIKNLRDQFYVGNVFYRNGKMVIMSSGSAFDGLLLNDVSGEIEYDINFRSKQMLFEKQIVCPVEPGEFNVSTNPTAVIFPSSSYDINQNGKFDFQDADILLRYMRYKNTEPSGNPTTDWSSSILNTLTDEELSVYAMYSASWPGTDFLFTENYNQINNSLFSELDFNQDNKIDANDMNILWKYFIYRLTQKNYETYITPNSTRKFLSDIIDFLNNRTLRTTAPSVQTEFLNFASNTKSDQTGSYLAPYVTTIGLYQGTELVAVAKLGSPIKITPTFPINFVVKMDF
jgi:hypothetical protein